MGMLCMVGSTMLDGAYNAPHWPKKGYHMTRCMTAPLGNHFYWSAMIGENIISEAAATI